MVLFGALLGGTASLRAEPARPPNRFLFLIDTSAGMKPYESSVREAMFDFIYSGLRGQMTNNDTYGLWLINEQNDTSFQMETWRQKFTVEMAAKAAAHIKNHGFKGRLNLNQAQVDLGNVIKNVDDLTIILITNGETPISGTPFDDAINIRFRELATGRKKARAAIFTTFAARDGVLLTWSPSSPEGEIRFPVVPPRPKPAKVEVAVETNAPAAVAVVPVAEPGKPKAITPSIIITKESVAQEKKSYQSMTTIVTNEPVAATNAMLAQIPPSATNAVSAVATVESKPVATVASPATPPVTPVVAVKTAPHAPATPTLSATMKSEPSRAEPTPFASAVAPSVAPPVNTATPPAAALAGAVLWAIIGAGGALLCVLVVFLACRSRRPAPSLISQSLVREQAGRTAA